MGRRAAAFWLLSLAALAAIAFAFRYSLSESIEPGQPQWVDRAQQFWQAASSGHWRSTFVAPHPGLPVLWLAGGAQSLTGAVGFESRAEASSKAVALVSVLVLVACVELVRRSLAVDRQLGTAISAFVAGLSLAADPVLVLTSGLVGLDGLFALLFVGSFLLLALHWRNHSPASLAAAALLGGLATATKGAGLILLLAPPLARLRPLGSATPPSWPRTLFAVVAFAAAAALVVALLLPAAWVEPGQVAYKLLFGGAHGGESLTTVLVRPRDNFLFGSSVEQSGPLFYLVQLVFRATPLVLLGAVGGLCFRSYRDSLLVRQLAAFALLVLVLFSLARQKEWRYMLPLLLLVDLLGALGFVAAGRWLAENRQRAALAGIPVLLFALQAIWVWSARPYYELCTNPLLGGPTVAVRAIHLGWTGGYRETTDFLRGEARRLGRPVSWSGGAFKWKLYDPRRSQGAELQWLGRDPKHADADCHVFFIDDSTFGPDNTDQLWSELGVESAAVVRRGLTLSRIRCRPERGFRAAGPEPGDARGST